MNCVACWKAKDVFETDVKAQQPDEATVKTATAVTTLLFRGILQMGIFLSNAIDVDRRK